MKRLVFIFCLFTAFIACDDNDKNDPTASSPIENLEMPSATTPFTTGQTVTIKGKGFTENSQIWLRNVTKAEGDIQATITQVDDNSISFTVPENVSGEKQVILKQAGKEYSLGNLTFEIKETPKEKLYIYKETYNNNKISKHLVEIDPLTEKEKVIATLDTLSEYLVYLPSSNIIAGVDDKDNKGFLTKFDIQTGKSHSIPIYENDGSYSNLFIDENENIYATKSSYPIYQIVKLATERTPEEVIYQFPEEEYIRNLIYLPGTKEIMVNCGFSHKIMKIHLQNKTIQEFPPLSQDWEYSGFVTDPKGNVFASKSSQDTDKIVKIDPTNGKEQDIITMDGLPAFLQNLVYLPSTGEIIARIDSDHEAKLLRVNIDTKQTKTVYLADQDAGYEGLIINR